MRMANPAHPAYERRGLYAASMRALEAEPLAASVRGAVEFRRGICSNQQLRRTRHAT
jgi:hypothetical protein